MSGFWRCHSPLYKLQAQRCAFGHVQKPVTVPDPIPESGGQPHQSASHLFIDHPLVLVVFWQAALAVSVTEAVFSNQCQKPHVLFPKSFQAHLGGDCLKLSLKNNLVIFDCLFGLDVFSLQSCATGTLLLQKDIYPRKYRQFFTNLLFNAY